jgi:flagellar protein FliJ
VSARTDRLATVLRVRTIQEEQRRGDLARAAAAQGRAAEAAAEAAARYGAREVCGVGLPLDTATFLATRQAESFRADGVSAAATEHALAEGETERSRSLLAEARTRTSGLERVLERAVEEHRLDRLAADQQVAEESGRARKPEEER